MTQSNVGARSISPNSGISLTEHGGTLADLLAQQTRLAFSTVVDYLDQLSEAIDLAHEQGFIHRNLNPSTILLTDEGHLVILGLRATAGRTHSREIRGNAHADSRLMRVTYMAPEQILAGSILSQESRHYSLIPDMQRTVDGRADLYSLGVILYQMVTGVLPFQAKTLEQMALMHLRVPPPPPRQYRSDLPPAAEQAMLRALAKRPADRYLRAQDLATALSVALIAAGQLDAYPSPSPAMPSSPFPVNPDPSSVNPNPFPVNPNLSSVILSDSEGSPVQQSNPSASFDIPAHLSWQALNPSPAMPSSPSPVIPVGAVPGAWPSEGSPAQELHVEDQEKDQPTNPIPVVNAVPSSSTDNPIPPLSSLPPTNQELEQARTTPIPPSWSNEGTLSLTYREQGNTGTLKLTGPAKIVQVPVAGQPGLFVTGLLPIFPQQPASGTTATATSPQDDLSKGMSESNAGTQFIASSLAPIFTPITGMPAKARKILILALVAILIISGSGLFWLLHTHTNQSTRSNAVNPTPNVPATTTAQVQSKVILTDPLNANIHNWPIATSGSILYVFENGAYHITDNNPKQGAPAILPDVTVNGPFAYNLTMEEIKGDDTSVNNEFGMIVRASSQNQNGKIVTTFYSFEVLNTKNGEYQFWKYDNGSGSSSGPWTKLWHHPFGKEFHQGHGSGNINTFKIIVNSKNFTLIVNGKQIAIVSDTSCKGCPCTCSGGIGMWVNLKGTEVAFSNLQLAHI